MTNQRQAGPPPSPPPPSTKFRTEPQPRPPPQLRIAPQPPPEYEPPPQLRPRSIAGLLYCTTTQDFTAQMLPLLMEGRPPLIRRPPPPLLALPQYSLMSSLGPDYIYDRAALSLLLYMLRHRK